MFDEYHFNLYLCGFHDYFENLQLSRFGVKEFTRKPKAGKGRKDFLFIRCFHSGKTELKKPLFSNWSEKLRSSFVFAIVEDLLHCYPCVLRLQAITTILQLKLTFDHEKPP
ncbi:MAG: hypothetical protein DYG95_08915 [Chlorobi bacterium CHB1]|nr:hypothetical protein [Chlorobi bacterium CHB1]